MLHEIRTRVRRLGARLVGRWVRVLPRLRVVAYDRLKSWRANYTSLIGVHLRGTDKASGHTLVPWWIHGAHMGSGHMGARRSGDATRRLR